MHLQIGKSNIPPMHSEYNTKFDLWVPKVLNCDTMNQITNVVLNVIGTFWHDSK